MFSKPRNEADHPTDENCSSLGCYLKEARINLGLRLEEIAEKTRIEIGNLIALEEDNRSALPADVFTRGFIKIYASFLKLDPDEAIRYYEKQWGSDLNFEVGPLKMIKTQPSFWPGVILALTLIAVFFGLRLFAPTKPQPTIDSYQPIPAQQNEVIHTPPQPVALPSPSATENRPHGEENSPPADAPPTAQPYPPGTENAPYEIVLRCSKEIPLSISLDQTRRTESLCPPESPQTWKAEKSFVLTLGDSEGVSLSINGVNLPLANSGGQDITILRP